MEMKKNTKNQAKKKQFLPVYRNPFPLTSLDQVSGCLKYSGKTKTLKEMEDAIRIGVESAGLPCP
jgi:hypothetical protein